MIRAALAIACLAAAPAAAQTALPSGLAATAADAGVEVQPDGESWLVLRYLAPAIAGGAVAYEEVIADLDQLCATEGLTAVQTAQTPIVQVVVVLMDRPVPRGETVPEATQYIGAYRVENGQCEWE